jgi:hypothetical protein
MDESRRTTPEARRPQTIPTVSAVLPSGALVEMICDLAERRSAFVVWEGGTSRVESSIAVDAHHRLVPYSADNNLIRNEVVLLASAPDEYGTDEELLSAVQDFIHRYTDLSPTFEKIASYYVLLSWVYDRFSELPYLRFRGDPGTGKTRSLLVIGSVCYKPIFASGASTVSPIFRILDAVRGTLIIDEGDFRLSDERAELVKILNNGNARGFPVLRSEVTPQREFNPRAYAVFGPKIVATRGAFEDRALESRFLTEEMGHHSLRDDVPISLPVIYKDEALKLRNKLLLFRFRRRDDHRVQESLVDRVIEPRLNQIFVPLLSIVREPAVRAELQELARGYNRELVMERSMDAEAHILEIIRDMLVSDDRATLSVKEITSWFVERHGQEYERKVTPKWIGSLIRRRLGVRTYKSHGVFVIARQADPMLKRLYAKYGVDPLESGSSDAAERLVS